MAVKIPKNPFKGKAEKLGKNIRTKMNKAGEILEEEIKSRVPVKTGRTKRSIDFIVKKIVNGYDLVVGSGVKDGDTIPYAEHIDLIKYLRESVKAKRKQITDLINSATRKTFK